MVNVGIIRFAATYSTYVVEFVDNGLSKVLPIISDHQIYCKDGLKAQFSIQYQPSGDVVANLLTIVTEHTRHRGDGFYVTSFDTKSISI